MDKNYLDGFDQLDVQLMQELESDARQNYTELAGKLGVTRPIITYRVQHLINGRVIDISCLPDPKALGFEIIATLAINVQSGPLSEIVQRLVNCASIRYIHLCTGSFNIVAWALLRNNDELKHLLLNELDSFPPVQHVETMLTIKVAKWFPMLLANRCEAHIRDNREKEPAELDDLDVKLIRELQIDARKKTTYLARKLGVHKTTINRRIQKLVSEDVIKFRAIIHPLALGYQGTALIGLSCDPARVNDVASTVASYKQVQFACICTGRYDVMAWVTFQKLSDLGLFITAELGKISALRKSDTMIIYDVVKSVYQLPL